MTVGNTQVQKLPLLLGIPWNTTNACSEIKTDCLAKYIEKVVLIFNVSYI